MQDTIKNLKTEKVELKNGKAKAEADLKKLEKKMGKNIKQKLVNIETQTDEEPTLPFNPSSTLSSLSEALSYSNSSDLNPASTASQFEDSFVEFDTRAIDDEPKVETEKIAVSNIQVHNLYETLPREPVDEDVMMSSRESISTESTTTES